MWRLIPKAMPWRPQRPTVRSHVRRAVRAPPPPPRSTWTAACTGPSSSSSPPSPPPSPRLRPGRQQPRLLLLLLAGLRRRLQPAACEEYVGEQRGARGCRRPAAATAAGIRRFAAAAAGIWGDRSRGVEVWDEVEKKLRFVCERGGFVNLRLATCPQVK